MKNLLLILLTLFSSCSVKNFYQVYQTESPELKKDGQSLIFEDTNCSVFYDLWAEGGNIGFTFVNKTDDYIYLNLEESHFIFNGIASDYFNNRIYTVSEKTAVKNSLGYDYFSNSYNSLVTTVGVENNIERSFGEKIVLRIPPHTAKVIKEFKINPNFYPECDLDKYPKPKDKRSVTFTKEDSPFVFSNILTYYLNEEPNEVINEFWVNEIKNLHDSSARYSKTDEECGKKLTTRTMYFNDASPDKFYVQYTQSY